jgi:hypothetical protein
MNKGGNFSKRKGKTAFALTVSNKYKKFVIRKKVEAKNNL